jgi:hypothetical protein
VVATVVANANIVTIYCWTLVSYFTFNFFIMADTPNWLENSRNAAPAAVENEMTLDAPANTATTDTAGNGEDDKDLPSIILYMRLANMGVATALIVISVRA